MYVGPNIVKNGLIFGIDTGYGVADNSTATRFYPGEPTINYGENSMSVYGSYWTNIGREGNTHTIYRHAGASSSTIAMAPNIFSGLPVGTVTTISGYLYKNGVPYNTTSNTISTYNTTISHETRDDGYFRYTQSLNYTNGSWNIHAVLISSPVEGDTIILKDLQMEVNTHSTPYLKYNTSRSSTQSLIDLTRTSTIDVANVSFDSIGQPVFDGANDRIAITDASKFYSNVWTWEFITKFNSNSGTYQGLVWGEGATGGGSGYQYLFTIYNFTYFHYRIYNTATQWTNTNVNIDFTPTEYNHIVWQFDNGNTKIYTNGELLYTDTSRGAYSGGETSPLYIGSRNDLVYNFNGSLPVAKHYNRILTAQEVQQNYNAYKNRFGL
jgi:hypothetical protein